MLPQLAGIRLLQTSTRGGALASGSASRGGCCARAGGISLRRCWLGTTEAAACPTHSSMLSAKLGREPLPVLPTPTRSSALLLGRGDVPEALRALRVFACLRFPVYEAILAVVSNFFQEPSRGASVSRGSYVGGA